MLYYFTCGTLFDIIQSYVGIGCEMITGSVFKKQTGLLILFYAAGSGEGDYYDF